MKNVAIVGFGRFGKVLFEILQKDFKIFLYDTNKQVFDNYDFPNNVTIVDSLKDLYKQDDLTVFFAVPINKFEEVIKLHSKFFKKSHLLMDVLSVKTLPKKIFDEYLVRSGAQAILSHPMFGPDSIKLGVKNLPFVFDRYTSSKKNYEFWTKYFKNKGFRIVELTAKEHDKLAANSQGVAHLIGRILDDFGFQSTPIDTIGAKKLKEIMDQTCNDTWELFRDLQNFNPYTKRMRVRFITSSRKISNKLLPKQINPKYVTFGIQGGKGSFNEQALADYTKRHGIKNFKTEYLYTTDRVLKQLSYGNIDYGLFAIYNAVGGVVEESINALAQYQVRIVEKFSIKIEHYLMKRKDIDSKKITTIMTHPQVLKQCKKNLKEKYSNLQKISGDGELIDHAKAAEALSLSKLPSTIAILGPKILSSIYNFDIIDGPLQDSSNNLTTFFLVSR